jgi:hypothetical protein
MTCAADFARKRDDLRNRINRLPRCRVRQRLQRQLHALVVDELRRESALVPEELPAENTLTLNPVPEFPEEEGHELAWFQK